MGIAYLPMNDTQVSAARSMAEIIDLLTEAGFTDTIQGTVKSEKFIVAIRDGVEVRFTVNLDDIKKLCTPKRGRFDSGKVQNKAERIAYRLLRNRVKAAVDTIKWGVETIGQALGGNLLMRDSKGRQVLLADFVTDMQQSGKLSKSGVIAGLLPSTTGE